MGGLGQLLNFVQQAALQMKGRHPQLLQARRPVLAGEQAKHAFHLGGERAIGAQVADVGVELGGFRVVVASGQVHIAPNVRPLAAADEHHFGVGLQAHHPIHHLGANALELFGPIDVGFFVKTRLELHHHRHFDATAHRLGEQVHHGRVGAGAVNGLLDGQHLRVVHGFAQKRQHPVKTLEGLVKQHVAFFAQLLEHRTARNHLGWKAGTVWRKQQLGFVDQIDQLVQTHQVDRAMHPVQSLSRQVKLLQQKVSQKSRAARRHLQAHSGTIVAVLQALAQCGAQVLHIFRVQRQV